MGQIKCWETARTEREAGDNHQSWEILEKKARQDKGRRGGGPGVQTGLQNGGGLWHRQIYGNIKGFA